MQTEFTAAQLADPQLEEANAILRTCVHCGFCLATCPTYLILGDELDSPRGRIYLAKEILETGRPATPQVVKHLDRCLTCLSCMTTCPSGVDYAHLIERARVDVESRSSRRLGDRLLRRFLALLVPYPSRFRIAVAGGKLARPFRRLMPGRLKAMVAMAPRRIGMPSPVDKPQVFPAVGPRRKRVTLLPGCAQQVLRPQINEASVRVLTRHGCEVVVARGSGCCGAVVLHMGEEAAARRTAKDNIAAWLKEIEGDGLDAIVFNASGCGVSLKDYGHLLRHDPQWAEPARRVAAISKDISEVLLGLNLRPAVPEPNITVAYHMACSMQHGLGLRGPAKQLLAAMGFDVREPAEAHICCGSAGSYSVLEPELADRLRTRKVSHLEAVRPNVIAAGNIGCINHIAAATAIPVVHTVELLDWMTGGRKPAELS
jgi:glycolate oxidase iron-sulfur subunit